MPDPASRPASWSDLISAEATKQGIDPRLALAVADTESSFNPAAVSKTGARGLMQLMPETAARLGVDPTDPIQNIRGGIGELKRLLAEHGGDVVMALRRYNGSPTAPTSATDPYVQAVLGRLQKGGGQPGLALGRPQVGTPPASAIDPFNPPGPPPLPGDRPRALPAIPDPRTLDADLPGRAAITAGRVAGAVTEGVDPRTRTGRRNIAGGAGAALGTAAVVGSGGTLAPVVIPLLGAAAGGTLAETGEQLVGTAPPSTAAALGAGAEQGAYELGGQLFTWPVKALGRRILATSVGKSAHEALRTARSATMERLADALDTASSAAGDVRQLVSDTIRYTRRQVGEAVRGARETAAGGVAATRATAAQTIRDARTAAQAGVTRAEAAGEAGVARATEQAQAGQQAAQAPYAALVGQPPSAIEAGRAAEAVLRGPAQEARDLIGRQVDEAARTGPPVDITALKREAQAAVDRIRQPEQVFPRKPPDVSGLTPDAKAALEGYAGVSIEQMLQEPDKYGRLLQSAGIAMGDRGVAAAQEEAARETLKHPAMGVLNRVLNADDVVPFYAAHLWKSELQNALQGTADRALKKQVTSLTEHVATSLRQALAGHEPYNQATAAYAKIVPLYTTEMGAAFRKAAQTDPESIVRLIKPGKPTAVRMLRDLLVGQSAVAGKAGEGQTAWDLVRSAWTHQNVLKGGIEKLGANLDALPAEFRGIFYGDATGQQVLQNLRTISAAYTAATARGAAGIAAAKTGAEGAVDAAKVSGRAGVESARDRARAAVAAATAAGQQQVSQAQQVGRGAVEQALQQGAGAKRQAVADIRAARRAKSTYAKTPTQQELHFAASSLAGRQPTLEELAAHGARAFILGPWQIWGGLSWMKLLSGPSQKDLIEWAAYSPANTQRLVKLMTGPSPTGSAIADVLRASGVLERVTTRGQTPAANVGQPPPR